MATKQPWMKRYEGVRVPGHGPQPCRVMIIGERPGKTEPRTGIPFTGAAGLELSRYLSLAGLHREDCYITNVVKDYRDEDPTEEEIARDAPELLAEILACQPEVIVAAGRFAARHLLGPVDMEQVHGLLHSPSSSTVGASILPVFHPAAGLHSGDAVPFIHHDFLALGEVLRGEHQEAVDDFSSPLYQSWTHAPLDPLCSIAVDTEGAGFRGRPISVQFTQRMGEGWQVSRRDPPQLQALRQSFASFFSAGGHLYLHNSLHDLNELDKLGIPIPDAQFTDTMILAYLSCLLPQGLKALAKRLAGMEMQSYEEVVKPAKDRLHRQWLEEALLLAPFVSAPEPELVWVDKKEEWRVRKPQSIEKRLKSIAHDLAKGKRSKKGEEVDIGERVKNWEDSAAEELTSIIGHPPQPTLEDIPLQDALNYGCRDADATLRIAPILEKQIDDLGLREICQIDHSILPMVNRMQQVGMLIDPEHFRLLDSDLTSWMLALRDEIAALVGVRINPKSSPQVAHLLFRSLRLPSTKRTKGGDASTQDKVLEPIKHLHPVIPLILSYREMSTIRAFARNLLSSRDSDNRIRSNIRVTRTASGRLATNSPNLLGIPAHSALGKRLRCGFIAPPGRIIANWDLDQIEMRVFADQSQDDLMLDIFRTGKDIHKITASMTFGVPVAEIAKDSWMRQAAKGVGFGVLFQITGAGLYDQFRLKGARKADGGEWSAEECYKLLEDWYRQYEGARRFVEAVKAECRRNGFIRDQWGRLRYLSAVWSSVEHIREEALRQAVSHKIQPSAQGIMKKGMSEIWRWIRGEGEKVKPLLQVHDAIMLEIDEEDWTWMDMLVRECLTETVRLSVPLGAKGEKGVSWGVLGS